MPRYAIDISDEDRDLAKALAKADDRSMASMLRVIFKRGLHVSISASKQRQNSAVLASDQRQIDVETTSNQRQNSSDSASDQQSPSPARGRGSSSGKKNKKKKREGCVVGVEETAERVISRINELRPEGTGFRPATYHGPIGKLLAKGFTAEDLIAVAEWKADECKRRADWQWFKPATLFRVNRFAEKLDEARAGVKITGQTGFAMTEGDQRAQRYDRRKAGKYPTHPTRGQR